MGSLDLTVRPRRNHHQRENATAGSRTTSAKNSRPMVSQPSSDFIDVLQSVTIDVSLLDTEEVDSGITCEPELPRSVTVGGHSASVTQCDILPSFIITSSLDSTLRIWDRTSFQFLAELPCGGPVYKFISLPLNKKASKFLVLAANENGCLVTWKVKTRKGFYARRTNDFQFHRPNPIRALVASSDKLHLATGCCFTMHDILPTCRTVPSVRGTVKTWDLTKIVERAKHPNSFHRDITYVCLRTMRQFVESRATAKCAEDIIPFGIRALAYTPDGLKLAVGFGAPENSASQTTSKMLVICCARTLMTLWIQETKSNNVNGLEFLPLTSSSSSSLSSSTTSSTRQLKDRQITFQLVVSTERTLQKYDVIVDDAEGEVEVSQCNWVNEAFTDVLISSVNCSSDFKWIASGRGPLAVIHDASSGAEVETLNSGSTSEQRVIDVKFSSDCRLLAITSDDHQTTVHHLERYQSLQLPVPPVRPPHRRKSKHISELTPVLTTVTD